MHPLPASDGILRLASLGIKGGRLRPSPRPVRLPLAFAPTGLFVLTAGSPITRIPVSGIAAP